MKAYTQEMQAKVVEAEAKVPAALAEALEKGRLGVMDYYRMNNIIADTDMRKMIAGNEQDVGSKINEGLLWTLKTLWAFCRC